VAKPAKDANLDIPKPNYNEIITILKQKSDLCFLGYTFKTIRTLMSVALCILQGGLRN
jgi:hypothetical protein